MRRAAAPAALLLAAALAAAVAATVAALAPARASEPDEIAFAIWRGDSRIGIHRLAFRLDGDTTIVETSIDIEVKVLFITAHRHSQRRTETWKADRLLAYDGRTDDNGTITTVTVRRTEAGLAVEGPAGRAMVAADTLLASWWPEATVRQGRLIDAGDGAILDVRIEDRGEDAIEAGGRTIRARRFHVTGGTEREVWYDAADGTWAQLAFAGRDGSRIVYRRLP
ncbi:MAG: hypothetical protein FJX67_14610 [Alphaproteobacteria bacterium]|nr:hypothetical protein [Alphaproteobacteria bacterium]